MDGNTIMKSFCGMEVYDEAARNLLMPVVTTGTGEAYIVNINTIKELNVGTSITIIPHITSASIAPTLQLNEFDAVQIRHRLSSGSAVTAAGVNDTWLAADKPIRVTYDGSYWIVDMTRPDANSVYGQVPVANGGTGADTAAQALHNLGITWGIAEPPATGTPNSIYIQIN